MNVDLRDTLRTISPVVLQEYLRSRGWSLVGQPAARGLVEYQRDGETVGVPLEMGFGDYPRRVSEVLETLVADTGESLTALLDDLTQPAGDVLAVRVMSGVATSGTLPVDEAIKLRQGARTLLLAAAHSAVSAQPWFPRMSRTEATELIGKVREGQTMRGSFAARFIVPVDPALDLFTFSDDDEPFGRRVVRLLLRALESVHRVRALGDYRGLIGLEKDGVSGNLLSALASMAPSATGTVEFSVAWARNRPRPAAHPAVRLTTEALVGLDSVAEEMRSRTEAQGYEVVGYVTHLAREASVSTGPGEITIVPSGPSDNASVPLSRVAVALDATAYDHAIEAHKNGDPVRVTGTLRKIGRRWVIERAAGFERITPAVDGG